MTFITAYHRPTDLSEALGLLDRAGVNSVVIGGGTAVTTHHLPTNSEVIDLQLAAPSGIERNGDRLTIGAMTRLQDVVDSELVPSLLQDLAHREGPSTFRHAATIGGTIGAANWESELLAGLLVFAAEATIAKRDDTATLPLEDLLANPALATAGIITSISIAAGGEAAAVRTGRTPADTPIVAVAARVVAGGFRVALTGVAATPVLVDPSELSTLDPPGDFRGSAEYRMELARTLTKRVIRRLGGES